MVTKLVPQSSATKTSCGRQREPRLWTLEDYEGLTVSLLSRFSAKELMCANLSAIGIDPGDIIDDILATIDDLSGDEEAGVWLRGVLAVLLSIYGYIRKITRARMYRWVLKKFIVFSLLMIALEKIITSLIKLVEYLILQEDVLRRLADLLNCTEEVIS